MKRKLVIGAVICALIGWIGLTLMSRKAALTATTAKPDLLTAVAVSIDTVLVRELTPNIEMTGTLVGNNEVAVASETSGKVLQVFVKVGDVVKKGDVLMQVDDELRKAGLMSAEANFVKAKSDFERIEKLLKDRATSEQQLDNVRLAYKLAESQLITAKRQLSDTKITSPIDGVVTVRPIDVGAMVQNGVIVANVVDVSVLKARINVAEKSVFALHAGDKATIVTDVYPGVQFSGTIYSISAKGDEAHTYPVEVMVRNIASHPLKSGMFAAVRFTDLPARKALLISRFAIVGSIKDPKVYVLENNIAKLRSVVIGEQTGDFVEVVNGLHQGEQIVVSGQNNLTDNMSVTIQTSK
jgi:RND family efflux transporter MFP subunit